MLGPDDFADEVAIVAEAHLRDLEERVEYQSSSRWMNFETAFEALNSTPAQWAGSVRRSLPSARDVAT